MRVGGLRRVGASRPSCELGPPKEGLLLPFSMPNLPRRAFSSPLCLPLFLVGLGLGWMLRNKYTVTYGYSE